MHSHTCDVRVLDRWELAEMARRFFLVGFFVDFEPGTITQIVVGMLFCAAFLMFQLQAKPYRSNSDDYLACASSFSLLVLFICSTIYKYDELTSSVDVQSKMSTEQKDDYIINSLVLSVCVIVSAVGALVSAAVILGVQSAVELRKWRQQKRLRYVKGRGDVSLGPPGDLTSKDNHMQLYHLFLSQ